MFTRIGPRKLCRVLRYVRDSTITRQPSDFGSRSSRVHEPSPTIVRGDTSQRKTTDQNQESYFELPRGKTGSNRGSLITPLSFMHASLADSPEVVDRQKDSSVEQPSPNADRVRRDLILLVEDNAINMRVSPHLFGCDSHVLRSGKNLSGKHGSFDPTARLSQPTQCRCKQPKPKNHRVSYRESRSCADYISSSCS
jgi:hypothetical protein